MSVTDGGRVDAGDRELVIERMLEAPREVVWKAWTEPDRIREWLAPRGFTVGVCEGDLTPGGRWRQSMTTPDGKELWLGGVYREIAPPERLEFTHAWNDENGKPGHETLVSLKFAENGDTTEMHFRQREFESPDSRGGHAAGWGECFERLGEYLQNR